MKITDAVVSFLEAIESDGLKSKTIAWYRWLLLSELCGRYGRRSVHTITASDLRRYIVEQRKRLLSEDTIHAHHRALHRFFNWCSAEYGTANPMVNMKLPKQPKPKLPKAISIFDIVRLIETCGDDQLGIRDAAMIAFLADTGCRAAGVCGLKLIDLDMDHGRAHVTEKGDKVRAVYFSETTAVLMGRWLDQRDRAATVFHNHRGAPITPNGLLQMTNRRKAQAGIRGRTNPHSFRHGFAREYLKAGGDLATLARILGHEDVSTTALFYGVFTGDEIQNAHRKHSPMGAISRVLNLPSKKGDLRESG